MRALVEAADAGAERAANQSTLLAFDDPADASTSAGGAGDDQRALPPRAVRAPGAIPRFVVRRSIDGLTIRTVADACDARHRFAPDEGVAHDSALTRPARD